MIRMNDTELRCFVAVADTLSFTKAAERLYFSVPTVTHHIQMLERELATELFVRTKQKVTMTAAGRVFYINAKQLLSQERLAVQNVKNLQADKILRIGCTSNSEAFRLIPLLKGLKTKYPSVIPEIHVENYDAVLRDLDMELIDFALGSKTMVEGSRLEYMKLCPVKVYIAVNFQNPLAARKSVIFEDLGDQPLLLMSPQMVPFNDNYPITKLFTTHAANNYDKMIDLEADAFPLIIAGYGGLIIPAYRMPPHIKELGIVVIPVMDCPKISYGLMYKKLKDEQLWDYIVESCKDICRQVGSQLP